MTNDSPEQTGAGLAAATGSAAYEAVKLKLVSAACQYAGGVALGEKYPGLRGTSLYKTVMEDVDQGLHRAARDYFAAVCELPNDKLTP